MILRKGDMWEQSHAGVILFTGNATIRTDGALVMGRGAALQAQTLFRGINKRLGGAIACYTAAKPVYGVILDTTLENPMVGVFQVKYNYWDKADKYLITNSCKTLNLMANTVLHKTLIAVNFPGIGYGGLDRRDVLPILQALLPDNVEVWEK